MTDCHRLFGTRPILGPIRPDHTRQRSGPCADLPAAHGGLGAELRGRGDAGSPSARGEARRRQFWPAVPFRVRVEPQIARCGVTLERSEARRQNASIHVCRRRAVGRASLATAYGSPAKEVEMDAAIWVIIALVAVIVIGVLVWYAMTRRRTGQLREQFGPEYDRTVDETEERRTAESELLERRRGVEELDIRTLDPVTRTSFADRWNAVQARFVDDPTSAVGEA